MSTIAGLFVIPENVLDERQIVSFNEEIIKPREKHQQRQRFKRWRPSAELELRKLGTPTLPTPTPDTSSTLIENTITHSVGHGPLPEQDSNSI